MDDFIGRFAQGVGKNLRDAKRSFDRRIGKTENPHVQPYRGYGNHSQFLVMGRALRDPGVTEATDTDNWLRNLANSYKRIETDELPGARVRVTWGSVAQELTADDEGFFRAMLPLSTPAPPDAGHWHNAHIKLLEPAPVTGGEVIAQTMVPPVDAQFGIISDLDDTVIKTGATDVIRMVRATLLGNARTRVPFPGVAAFYAALQAGATRTSFNPIFYVSSSPWNLYDVLEQFMALQRIPMGPVMLRDWGMSLAKLPINHSTHKLESIHEIFAMYPTLPFVLIGDSGQQDPEIYLEVARTYPGRVRVAYIRDVTSGTARTASLQRVAAEMAQVGSTLVVVADTMAAARHAAEAAWINAEALSEIEAEKEQNARA